MLLFLLIFVKSEIICVKPLIFHEIPRPRICENFYIYHDFSNCFDDPQLGFKCPNQGTCNCSYFNCDYYRRSYEREYHCGSGTTVDLGCTERKDIRYIDFWVRQSGKNWGIYFLGGFIAGFDNSTKIIINNEFFERLYNTEEKDTFISIVLGYYEECKINIELYINGKLEYKIQYKDPDPFITCRNGKFKRGIWETIFVLIRADYSFFDASIYSLSAHTFVPSTEEIVRLYKLGKKRSSESKICT